MPRDGAPQWRERQPILTKARAKREESKVGTFPDGLMAQAKKQGWVVISKNDWRRIFAFEDK